LNTSRDWQSATPSGNLSQPGADGSSLTGTLTMQKRKLGTAGLEVSAIGLGA
jgi:hypothetical protein